MVLTRIVAKIILCSKLVGNAKRGRMGGGGGGGGGGGKYPLPTKKNLKYFSG